jgi:hypothetical protein
VAQEYVARETGNPDVTGHSRDPGYALLALLTKVRELKAEPVKKRRPESWVGYKGQPVRFGAQSGTSGHVREADAQDSESEPKLSASRTETRR